MTHTVPVHLSFICTGNICRSPIAAIVCREHLRRAGLAEVVTVTSAGTGPWHVGERADHRARAVLAEHGYDSTHTAAQVGAPHADADLFLALDAGHARELARLVDGEVRLLRSFDPVAGDDLDVPDPYYGGRADFVEVLAMVEAAMPGLLDWVRQRL
ncbi:protein-tyrosine phosphatase [Crossiella equi]|uniref:protein-tyrosine-phosphatase n=1 Tax=Crossiella equi TaxID=130796 RepID=A0ABS5ABE5_9PSEU|nr:low molecular weight protein-tyrosine-phosphatase [Crossiella equi]MBP2473895.1 protein-tyrosine phosphatase [Crossiella equi]